MASAMDGGGRGRWWLVAVALATAGCHVKRREPAGVDASVRQPPMPAPAETTAAGRDGPVTAGQRRSMLADHRWDIAAATLDESGADDDADAIANGCTRAEMPDAMLHERQTLREALTFGLEFTDAVKRAEPLNAQQWHDGITHVSGWRAGWLHLPRTPGLCIASFRYVLDGELKIASFFYAPGAPALAAPANEEGSRIATAVDANFDMRANVAPVEGDDQRAEGAAAGRHLLAGDFRDALRNTGLLDAYVDRIDSSILVVRTRVPCTDGAMVHSIANHPAASSQLREVGIRRVECSDAESRGSERLGEDVAAAPVGRRHHRR